MFQRLFAHRDRQVIRRLAHRVARLIVVLIAVTLADRVVAAGEEVRPISFDDAILPVLTAKCGRCHGAETQKGQLALHSAKSLRAGGEGGPVLVAGKPEESRLIEVLEAGEMPPDGKNRLTADELASLTTWIHQGAKFTDSAEADRVTQHEVVPILLLRCVVCHGGRRREADLDLRSRDGMLRGGKSGPSIVPGDPGSSLLLKRILAEEMPPRPKLTEAMVKPLEPAEFEVISRWIEQGAVEAALPPDLAGTAEDPLVRPQDREFWSFQPPQRPKIPETNDKSAARNTIDRFILTRLDSLDLKLSPPADPMTLLRRATFDLTGLPPTPEEIARFRTETENRNPEEQAAAYDRLIDRLLESPRYGERWGRHWLDVAGYADCEGRREQHLPRPDAWRYRDYVIRSFNADKPYDRFLQEQLAGDELADYTHAAEITQEIEDNLVATGFLRMAPDPTWANLTGFVPDRLEVIADSLDVLGSGVMGMTLKCCRCHSHKFDPLPQRDYYRIAAIFKGAYDEHNWLKPDTVGFGGALNAGLAARNLAVVTTTERNRWLEQIQAIDAEIATLKSQGNGADIQAKIRELEGRKPREPKLFALWDSGDPSPTYIYRRGDYQHAGTPVSPGIPSVLNHNGTPFEPSPPFANAPSTGRRLAFAQWLTRRDNPLTARVIVNRVWHLHFGRGIVRSLGNFGVMGDRPTHPELLDWLACELMDNGWSLKRLHRVIMTSATYRQASVVDKRHSERDADNQWLSRMPLRRLDAEALRDSLLFAGGTLDESRFGPGDPVQVRADGLVSTGSRRSVYVQHLRKHPATLLESFDLPQMNPNCLARSESLVAPQALHLMNDTTVRQLAERAADRVVATQETSVDRVKMLFEQILGRDPSEDESSACVATLDQLTDVWNRQPPEPKDAKVPADQRALRTLAHTLINSAAFLYID